ncbi:6-phosphogluconate dehydrogenase [Aspergillus undulatus]|uniref:6-phosphogluconate dehydrogenase n=1 Tax=Aspergillus undulatus TaxID=1810928 RepID=UPI003CCCD3DD
MGQDKPVIGILSIGEMGLGIANLLISHGYRVASYVQDRSKRTQERAASIPIECVASLQALVQQSTVILSIVPPKDSASTAQSILDNSPTSEKEPTYYLDLNATAPSLAKHTADLFSANGNIIYIDGGIIGGPPTPNPNPTSNSSEPQDTWTEPSLVTSGPTCLPDTEVYNHLTETLNIEHISPTIGAASGTKLCFASMTKGFFALAIQSFVTAEKMGVASDLRRYMERHNSATLKIAERGLVGMPPKAWRWVNEMQQIGGMMEDQGGFRRGLFEEIAEVYRVVTEDTALGLEQAENRERGMTVEDVVAVMKDGMDATRQTKEKAE